MADVLTTIKEWAATSGLKLIIAVIVLIVAFRLINWLFRKLKNNADKAQKVDATLLRTALNVGKVAAKILVVIALVGYLGIDTSGLAALVASLGVCFGLAVNGALSNLAGGVLLLITRPFSVGDYISAQGYDGTVEDIRITCTKLATVDNRVVYLPNGALSSGNIVNFSEKDLRRVDLTFSVAGNDPEQVRSLVLGVCAAEPLVLESPEPFARITEYGAGNGTKVTLRAWCANANYWDCYFNLLSAMNRTFEANGIVIPFPQMDVHIKNN